MPKNPILDLRIYDPEREMRYRKENKEKQKKIQDELNYERLKEEQKKEQEQKKKELSQNLKRRHYTFTYDANFLFLKPQKDQEILVNDITEINFDSKKKPIIKNVEPIVILQFLTFKIGRVNPQRSRHNRKRNNRR